MSIEVHNESGYPGVNEDMLMDVASFCLQRMDVHPGVEVGIHLVDLAIIEDLHVRWLDLPGPTDVMSFPVDEYAPGRPDAPAPGPLLLGDIVLCPEFAQRQAEVAGHGVAHELALLTVHGCLHLLGYDHTTPDDERRMFSLQNEVLADWYDSVANRGMEFQEKPTGPGAFPTAADREALDRQVPGGGIPALGEPQPRSEGSDAPAPSREAEATDDDSSRGGPRS